MPSLQTMTVRETMGLAQQERGKARLILTCPSRWGQDGCAPELATEDTSCVLGFVRALDSG